MKLVLSGAQVYVDGQLTKTDVLVHDGIIADISNNISPIGAEVISFDGCVILPGLVDVHVHLREPGFSYKETIKSGTRDAAKGGFTPVSPMPTLNPAPDTLPNLRKQLDIIEKDACINVVPYGTITKERAGKELAPMEETAPFVAGFSDDGSGIQGAETMYFAMQKAKDLGKIIAAHCEDMYLVRGGCIHDGDYAKSHNLPGICSESEYLQIKRDLVLAQRTEVKYHVCHISTKESVELIRQAKAIDIDVTCETAPHYLIFSDNDLQDLGRFKMNPPIRTAADRDALIEGILDGTIDMIATDHAPHSAEEKSRGLLSSAMGVVGLECAFPVMYTHFVKSGKMPLSRLVELMSENPRKRFGIGTELKVGEEANLCVFDLNEKYKIDPETFESMGRATPFEGMEVYGRHRATIAKGKIVL